MNKHEIEKAVRIYSVLLHLYPKKYRQSFRREMVQTFKDHYRDVYETQGKVGLNFWIDLVIDDIKGIGREQLSSAKRKQHIPFLLLVVLCLVTSSTLMTVKISPVFMVFMLVVILFAAYFFIKKLSQPFRKSVRSEKHVWIKHGALYGLLLGLFLLPMNAVNMLTIQNLLSFQAVPIGLLFLAGMPLILVMSGYTTGQRSKEAKQGLLSGILSAVIGSGVIVLSTVVLMFVFWNFASTNVLNVSSFIGDWQYSWGADLGVSLVTTVILLVFGAILGGVGGLIGKRSTNVQSKL